MGAVCAAGMCACQACTCLATCLRCNFSERGSRAAYFVFMTALSATAIVLREHGSWTKSIAAFRIGCSDAAASTSTTSFQAACAGNTAAYRISFSLMCMHLLLTLVGGAAKCAHTGVWFLKIAGTLGLATAMFFVNSTMFQSYADAARVISVFFMLLQVIILVDFAYAVHEWIIARADASDEAASREPALCSNGWRILYLALSVLCYALALLGIVLLFSRFSCFLPNFMTSLAALSVLIFGAMSFTRHSKGILVSGVMSIYVVFQTFNALSDYPKQQCNPMLTSSSRAAQIVGIAVAAVSLGYTCVSAAGSVTQLLTCGKSEELDEPQPGGAPASSTLPIPEKQPMLTTAPPKHQSAVDEESAGRRPSSAAAADEPQESRKVVLERVVFHFVMCLGAIYMSMLLTDWQSNSGMFNPSANPGSNTSMAVKLISLWVANALFFWTLIAPAVCTSRSFE